MQQQFSHPIEHLVHKGNKKDIIGNIFYNLMTNCHLGYRDILCMPIPMAVQLLNNMKKEQKDMEKQMKKGKR